MAAGYLGTFPYEVKDTPFADYETVDWMMYFIEMYGQFDGESHKAWVLDQVARIRWGAPIEIVQARWENHEPEWRISVGEPTREYHAWVEAMKGDWDESNRCYEYDYDEGTAP